MNTGEINEEMYEGIPGKMPQGIPGRISERVPYGISVKESWHHFLKEFF